MKVDLDIHEMYYLLDNCLRGSHLRSGTIERFVDQWYDLMSENQRLNLFEWAVRLSYSWSGHKCFEPSSAACGKDVIFMKRYHPDNQYEVQCKYKADLPNGKRKSRDVTYSAFRMNGKYYVDSRRFIEPEFIVKVKKVSSSLWETYKQPGVDYDKNIIED